MTAMKKQPPPSRVRQKLFDIVAAACYHWPNDGECELVKPEHCNKFLMAALANVTPLGY